MIINSSHRKAFTLLLLCVLIALSFLSDSIAQAQGRRGIFAHVPPAGLSGISLPNRQVYAIDNANNLYRLTAAGFKKEKEIRGLNGQLIGIDFRPANGLLYGVTHVSGNSNDLGAVYVIDPENGRAERVPNQAINPRFGGGFQSLMDFNPVVDAIRLIGSSDENFALVSANGGLFNVTAVQTSIAYADGDPNAGVDPNLAAGAYTNNVAGAQTTVFFGIDYRLGNLVAVPVGANGSSATGAGRIQTLGPLRYFSGNPLLIDPTADVDIYTDANGNNLLVGIAANQIFTIDLAQFNPLPAIGQVGPVTVRAIQIDQAGLIDIAVVLRGRD